MGGKSPKNKSSRKGPTRSTNSNRQSPVQTSSNPELATNKRHRSDSAPSSPETIQATKLPAMSTTNSNEPITLAAIQHMLSEQTKTLKQFIQTEVKTQCDELSKNITEEFKKVNSRVDLIETHVNKQLVDMNAKVDNYAQKFDDNSDEFDRLSKLNELKITGIQLTNDHNLRTLFDSIAGQIGFDLTTQLNIPSLKRTYSRSQPGAAASPTNTIIATFVAKHIRDDFFSKYLNRITKNNPITTQSIGLTQAGMNVMVNECLTLKNLKILIAANSFKKSKELAQVYTRDGIVYIKSSKTNQKGTPIRSLRELETFMEHVKATATPPMETETTAATTSTTGQK